MADKAKAASKGKSSKGKKGAGKTLLGPSTVVRPCLFGATMLLVLQTVLRVFLKA